MTDAETFSAASVDDQESCLTSALGRPVFGAFPECSPNLGKMMLPAMPGTAYLMPHPRGLRSAPASRCTFQGIHSGGACFKTPQGAAATGSDSRRGRNLARRCESGSFGEVLPVAARTPWSAVWSAGDAPRPALLSKNPVAVYADEPTWGSATSHNQCRSPKQENYAALRAYRHDCLCPSWLSGTIRDGGLAIRLPLPSQSACVTIPF
jgi:hypothetical protein